MEILEIQYRICNVILWRCVTCSNLMHEYLSHVRLSFRYFLLYKIKNPWQSIKFKWSPATVISLSEIHSQLHGNFGDSIQKLYCGIMTICDMQQFDARINYLSHVCLSFRYFLLYKIKNPWQDIKLQWSPATIISLSEIHSQLHENFGDSTHNL